MVILQPLVFNPTEGFESVVKNALSNALNSTVPTLPERRFLGGHFKLLSKNKGEGCYHWCHDQKPRAVTSALGLLAVNTRKAKHSLY